MPPPGSSTSLLKYETPVLAGSSKDKRPGPAKAMATSKLQRGKSLPPMEKSPQPTQTEDVLNSILPPREFTEEGQVWVQHVSSTPATRLDVLALQKDLDRRLQERHARETGICPIREELFGEAFDELIRQVTINCAERGMLLSRVREELRMTVNAYRTLYESSIAFAVRKALQAEQGKAETTQLFQDLNEEKAEIEKQLQAMKLTAEERDRTEAEQRQTIENRHNDEVTYLRRQVQHLKSQLEAQLAAPSSKG